MAQLWILSVAVLCASHAYASDSTRSSGNADGVQKTKPFGKLSLSLSLTLSVPVSKPATPAGTVKASDAQPGESTTETLSELNAKIAAIEEMISARQRQLDIVPASPLSPGQASLQPTPSQSPDLATPAETVSAEPVQGAGIVGESGVASVESGMGNENPQPKIVAPTVRSASTGKNSQVKLPGMGWMDWAIALLVPLLAASGFVWYRRRKVTHTGKLTQIGKPGNNQTANVTRKEPSPVEPLDMTVVPSSTAEQVMQMPAKAEPPQTQQSILPPEYEMLEEADIYLRFGHDKLAEEALREAIKINPKNPQAYLTLLRIYFSREDSAAFLALAQQLKSLGDGSVWPRVAEMGRNLDADNPLYR